MELDRLRVERAGDGDRSRGRLHAATRGRGDAAAVVVASRSPDRVLDNKTRQAWHPQRVDRRSQWRSPRRRDRPPSRTDSIATPRSSSSQARSPVTIGEPRLRPSAMQARSPRESPSAFVGPLNSAARYARSEVKSTILIGRLPRTCRVLPGASLWAVAQEGLSARPQHLSFAALQPACAGTSLSIWCPLSESTTEMSCAVWRFIQNAAPVPR